MAHSIEKSQKTKKSKNTSSNLKKGHTEELVDHYWGSMGHVNSLIKASEIKAGLILSFYGILLNFIYQSSNGLVESFSSDMTLSTMVGLWFVATTISIFYCVRCFIPKIEGNYDKNVFFFGDVISKFGSIKQFAKTFYEISLDEKELFRQLGEQIFILSKIADWKFRNVKRAILFLAISLGLLFITGTYYSVTTLV